MTPITFRKAERSQVYLKLGITGPTGSGKTYSALRLAMGLLEGTGKRIAFLDTENDSASLYSDKFDFDVLPVLPPFEPEHFASGVRAAVEGGYGACVVDSASHFWKGVLDFKDQLDRRGGNSYTNWKDADKKFDPVISEFLQSKIHLICCMRSKMEYILEDNGKGKQAPKKVGLAPIMRDGVDYEFSVVLDIAMDHTAQASKDRTELFPVDKIFTITEDTGKKIRDWLLTAKPKADEPDAANAEHAKRLEARIQAAASSKPDDADADDWQDAYASVASLKVGRGLPVALKDFTTAELKLLTTQHDAIVKILMDKAKVESK
jgi:hypothetical protein